MPVPVWLRMGRPKGSINKRFNGLKRMYALTPELEKIVGLKEATRIEVMKHIWKYIRYKKLQDPRDKRYFYPNHDLLTICGPGRLKVIRITKYLGPHLSEVVAKPKVRKRRDSFGFGFADDLDF